MNKLELTGRAETHIKRLNSPDISAEQETASAFSAMKEEAAKSGLSLSAYSSFRDFNAQLGIWNAKYSGNRTLYSQKGELLDFESLSSEHLIFAILAWSALPGASRHHWGTDIDIIDTAALPADYKVQLLPEEYLEGGVFHDLHCWLEENMQQYGFFKPYRKFQGGVCEEPWHLSYAPVSKNLIRELSVEMVNEAISSSNLLGKEQVLEILPDIFKNFVLNICD